MLDGIATPTVHGKRAGSSAYNVLPCRVVGLPSSCTVHIRTGYVLSVCAVDWAPDQSSLSSFLGCVHHLLSTLAIGTVCRRACHRAKAPSRAGVMTSVPLACWHARAHPKHPTPSDWGAAHFRDLGPSKVEHIRKNGFTERTRPNKARFAPRRDGRYP